MINLNQKNNHRVMLLRLVPTVYKKNNHPVGYRPPYTLKYIEAILRKNGVYDVHCQDQRITDYSLKDIKKEIIEQNPNIIIFDISTLNVQTSAEFCKDIKDKLRNNNLLAMAIGQEVSADVRKFKNKYPMYDIVLGGEAEIEAVSVIDQFINQQSVLEIRQRRQQQNIDNNIWTVTDLDSLPFLHFDSNSLYGYNFVYPLKVARKLVWGHIITSRGCPHPCIFCSQLMREGYGTKMRYRSAQHVVNEMEELINLGANIIAFDDEDFTVSARHVQSICDEILRRNLKVQWIIHSRADELNHELLKKLAQCGCILIRMGIETANLRILKILQKTRNNEKLWFDKTREVVKQAKSLGISVACLFMVGSPTETREEVLETIKFAQELSPEIIQVAYFTPFPGTKAYLEYRDVIEDIDDEDLYHYDTPQFNVSGMSKSDLKKAQGLFYKKFLMRPSFVIDHFSKHILFYIFNYHVFLKLIRFQKHLLKFKPVPIPK